MGQTDWTIESLMNSITDKQKIDFAYWISHLTEYGEQELLDYYRDHLNGIQSFNCFFRHTPVKSISPYSTRSFYVTIKGKTLEEAIKNYKRDFDKEKFKTVEFVSVVEKNNATQKE